MFRYLAAENIKIKHTFLKKLIWLAPISLMMLSFLLTYNYFQVDNYNWSYTMVLPGMLSLSCGLLAEMDRKMKNMAVLSLAVPLKQVWYAKVIVILEILAGYWMIIFGANMISSFLLSTRHIIEIPMINALGGSILLIITFMWQIPLCLFLNSKIGLFPAIFLNIAANFVLSIAMALKNTWVFVPYSYPARLMCPVLKILPNGLEAKQGSVTFKPELLSYQVICPAVLISVILFLILTYVTGKWFEQQEAK